MLGFALQNKKKSPKRKKKDCNSVLMMRTKSAKNRLGTRQSQAPDQTLASTSWRTQIDTYQ